MAKKIQDKPLQPVNSSLNTNNTFPNLLKPVVPTPAPTQNNTSGSGGITTNTEGIIRGEQGQITGMMINGTPYSNIGLDAVNKLSASRLNATKGSTATQALEAVGQEQQAQLQAQAQQELINQNASLVNQVTPASMNLQGQATDLSQTQAGLAGVREGLPNIAKSIATGAGIGAGAGLVTGGALSLPLAVIGGVGGLIKGTYDAVVGNLGKQAGESISSKSKILTSGRKDLNKLIALTKADPRNADQYLATYQQKKAEISQAYSNLILDTNRVSYNFLSKDGTEALQNYENFYSTGGQAEIYDANMQLALLGKNPDTTDLMMFADELTPIQ